jgi:YidC/Oxa1 family membrane protein insertase
MSVSAAFGAVVGAAHSAIEGLATLLTPVAGPSATALAIVLFTLLVRLAISPLTYLQIRGQRRRSAIAPQVAKLREKHRDDPVTLAAATVALHRANGSGLLGALLPGLAQAPFFMVMYRVALHAPAGGLFGVPLTAHLFAGWPAFAVLLVLASVLARWSAGRMSDVPAQLEIMRYLPYLTVLTVAWLPLAAALYLVTSTAWTALEQLLRHRAVTTGN